MAKYTFNVGDKGVLIAVILQDCAACTIIFTIFQFNNHNILNFFFDSWSLYRTILPLNLELRVLIFDHPYFALNSRIFNCYDAFGVKTQDKYGDMAFKKDVDGPNETFLGLTNRHYQNST